MWDMSIWEIISWIGLFSLAIWIILKLSGVIQTPLIFELAPMITLFLILGSLLADMKNVKFELRRAADSLVKLGHYFKQLKGKHDVIRGGMRKV
jgi:hypothetical protein